MTHAMRPLSLALATAAFAALAGPAHADCFADYKAKQDNPLRLHYGVAEVPDGACGNPAAAAAALGPRLARAGWTLLNVVGTFGPEGLAGRQASAGEFYLRY